MAAIVKLKDGSLQLQGSGEVIPADMVMRSPMLAKVSQHARNGAVKPLPVKTELVGLWLSVAAEEEKRLEKLSAKQLAGVLMAVHALGDSRTLQDVCAAQRDRVTKATAAAPPSPPRSSHYHKIRPPRSLARLLSGQMSSDKLSRAVSMTAPSDVTAPSTHATPCAHAGERPALERQRSWAGRLLCCGIKSTVLGDGSNQGGRSQKADRSDRGGSAGGTGGLRSMPSMPSRDLSVAVDAAEHGDRSWGAQRAETLGEVYYADGEGAPLLWLEEVVSSVSPDIAPLLLRPVWRTLFATGSHPRSFLPTPRPNLPPPIKQLVARAAIPAIDSQHGFTATVTAQHADFAELAIPHLPTLTSATLRAVAGDDPGDTLMRTARAACTLPALHTLRLSMPDLETPLLPSQMQQMASHLRSTQQLQTLGIHSAFETTDEASAELASTLSQLTSLTHLELSGAAARPIAAALSSQISSLTALQGLHVDDKDISDPSVVHLLRAAASLPRLTLLDLDATGNVKLSREKFCTGGRTRQIIAAAACATRLQALSIRSPVIDGRSLHAWCDLGATLAERSSRFEQLTRLELVGGVTCGQLQAVAQFIRGMPQLRSLNVVTGENYCGSDLSGDVSDEAVAMFAGALAGLTQLTAVALSGPDVPAARAIDFLSGLGGRPALRTLGLVAGDMGTARDAARMLAACFPALQELSVESDRAVQGLHGCRGLAGFVGSMRKLLGLQRLTIVARGALATGDLAQLAPGLRQLSQLRVLHITARFAEDDDLGWLMQLVPDEQEADKGGLIQPGGPGLVQLQELDLANVMCGTAGQRCVTRGDVLALADGEPDAGLLLFPQLQTVALLHDAVLRADLQLPAVDGS
eukprot:jgi/Ulvmu1/3577/UM168_0009.1